MTQILDKANGIITFIVKGIGDVFNFIMELPSFINSMINIIPTPFKEIILSFVGIILVYFIAKAVMTIVSWCNKLLYFFFFFYRNMVI